MRRFVAWLRTHQFSAVAFGLLLVAATLGYFAIVWLLQSYVARDYMRPPTLFASFGPGFYAPELLEMPLYAVGYLLIPLLTVGLYAAYRRGGLRRLAVPLTVAIAAAGILASLVVLPRVPRWIGLAVAYAGTHGLGKMVWLLLTKRLFAMRLLFVVVLGILLAQLLAPRLRPWLSLRWDQARAWRWLEPALLVAVVVFLLHPNFPVEPHHQAYFLGPANDMLHGKPLLYETSHLYGLLSMYALAGLFALGLPLSYQGLELVLYLSFAGFFVGWYHMLRGWLGSRTLAAVGLMAAIALLFLFQTSPTRSAYHFPAMTPWRFWLSLPVLALLLAQAHRPKRWRRMAIIGLSAIAVYWNFEYGLFTLISSGACLLYLRVAGQPAAVHRWKAVLGAAVRLAALGVAAIGVIGVLLAAVNFAVVGGWPDLGAYLHEVLPFAEGSGMSRLPVVGLFELFVIVYLAFGCNYIRRLLRHQPLDVGVLFCSLFGAGSLLYYIGESTWQNLYLVTAPLIALLLYAFRQLLDGAWSDYTVRRCATAALNTALVLVAGMLLLKVPVELATRDYAKVGESFTRPAIADPALAGDAAVLAKDYGHLDRLAVMHRADVPLLLTLGKANALDLYYLFNLYYAGQVDALLAQIQRERPPVLIVGKVGPVPDAGLDLDDQVRYFRARLPPDYRVIRQLQTLDVYQRAESAP